MLERMAAEMLSLNTFAAAKTKVTTVHAATIKRFG